MVSAYENSIRDFVKDNYPDLKGKEHELRVLCIMSKMKSHERTQEAVIKHSLIAEFKAEVSRATKLELTAQGH